MNGIKYLAPYKILSIFNKSEFPIIDSSISLSQIEQLQSTTNSNQLLVDQTDRANNIGTCIQKTPPSIPSGIMNQTYTLYTFSSSQIKPTWNYAVIISVNVSLRVLTGINATTATLYLIGTTGSTQVSSQQNVIQIMPDCPNFVIQNTFYLTAVSNVTYSLTFIIGGTNTSGSSYQFTTNSTFYPNYGGELILLGI